MPRFNVAAAEQTKTTNRAGGEAFVESPKLAFAALLLTSFANEQFYRSSGETFDELKTLLTRVPPEFAAKAAIYARREFGMRSITHVAAAEIIHMASGQRWTRAFIQRVVRRPDDMTEILAYYLATYGHPIPNALKNGLALAFDQFDGFALARYRADDKKVSLIDVVNLCHPKPTERNREALAALVKDELRNSATWDARLTQAGQEGEEGKVERKAEVWAELLNSGSIGYFALLRNLRNIIEQAPGSLDMALELLVDTERIHKSLVLPFRYQTAIGEIAQMPGAKKVLLALAKALDTAVANVPRFTGRTLIAVDESGSMQNMGLRSTTPIDIASLFGAVLYKAADDADVMAFATNAVLVTNISPADSVVTLASTIGQANQGGTNFHAIFQAARRAYDRIVILSDMQAWIGEHTPAETFRAYKKQFNANPRVYSFDLAGHGTLQFPEPNVYCLAGFSEKVFDVMRLLEEDRNALVHTIEAVSLT